VRTFFAAVLLAALGFGAGGYYWIQQPLGIQGTVDLSIEPGSTARQVANEVVAAGVPVRPGWLYAWFRLSGAARQIKAGSYELDATTSPRSLLQKLVQGDEALKALTLVEGWTFSQVLAALQKEEDLKHLTKGMAYPEIMAQLGKPDLHPEGRFFPDTYMYAKGSTDLAVLQRAMHAMDKKLNAVWAQRRADTPLKSPDQALALASIVEKETGRASDQPMISAVFTNRLRIGMRLQTDPTVIYGLGAAFDGNLRKIDLLTDTPYNTYTRNGLPPTPISMPGKAALLAAVQPANAKALYFVARGDGTSEFSNTLDEHNRAVNKYQR
jgi:UPF0755 protein